MGKDGSQWGEVGLDIVANDAILVCKCTPGVSSDRSTFGFVKWGV